MAIFITEKSKPLIQKKYVLKINRAKINDKIL